MDEGISGLRVLVVDDSAVFRQIVRRVIEELGAIVAAAVANGRLAVARLEQQPIDFMVLDLEMPELDGLATLRVVRERWPDVGVVMLSGSTRSAADLTVQALAAGALEFLSKPEQSDPARSYEQILRELGAIVRGFLTQRQLRRLRRAPVGASLRSLPPAQRSVPPAPPTPAISRSLPPEDGLARPRPSPAPAVPSRTRGVTPSIDVVAIGTSTGGPQALNRVIPLLPAALEVPVVVVQHMPPVFTASLAQSLDRVSRLQVLEAQPGQALTRGQVLIAPGGSHLVLARRAGPNGLQIVAELSDAPPENSCRPSVDVLFRSVAALYGSRVLAVVMTGMGEDGALGAGEIKQRGGYCLTQSAETCVIYGMPRAVDVAGHSDESLPLDELAGRIAAIAARSGLVRGTPNG